ncbi:putative SOS response-associated peptidase YedK [compost metagenome]
MAHSSYWRAIWPHRALCPVNGWFEWVTEGGPKKQPYFIRRQDGQPTLCAAIGQFAHDAHTELPGEGVVIITADSLGGMVDIHDRRPVALSPEMAREWLDPLTPKERAEQIILQQAEPADAFEWFRVSPDVGNSRNNGENLICPWT